MENKKYPVRLGDRIIGECDAPDENGVSEITITSPELLELVNKAPSFGMSVRFSAEFTDDEKVMLTDSGTIEDSEPITLSPVPVPAVGFPGEFTDGRPLTDELADYYKSHGMKLDEMNCIIIPNYDILCNPPLGSKITNEYGSAGVICKILDD